MHNKFKKKFPLSLKIRYYELLCLLECDGSRKKLSCNPYLWSRCLCKCRILQFPAPITCINVENHKWGNTACIPSHKRFLKPARVTPLLSIWNRSNLDLVKEIKRYKGDNHAMV